MVLVMNSVVHADAFQEGLNVASSYQNQAYHALKQFDPNQAFTQYNNHPKESDYYDSVVQDNNILTTDTAHQTGQNETAKTLQKSFLTRPQFVIDPNAPNMQQSQIIQNNATDIVNGISNQFVDCTQQKTCTMTNETTTCDEAPSLVNTFCRKTLTVDMIPHSTETHHILTVHLSANQHNYAGAVISAMNGVVTFLGPSESNFSLKGSLPANIDCQSYHGSYKIINSQHHTKIDSLALPACSNDLAISVHISGKNEVDMTIEIDMVSTTITLEQKDHWVDQCETDLSNKTCSYQSETCLEANATHVLEGVPVTRACWEYEFNYLCKTNSAENRCSLLRDQGCEQIGSVCKEIISGGCVLFSQTYRCPIKKCNETGVVCNGDTYCLTGDCITHNKEYDPDFQKSISALSTVNEAAKKFDGNIIFTGHHKTCNSDVIGFADCCKDDGWGVDIHLAQCSQEEKELGKAKENKQTVYIGSYCDKDALGVCITHRKAYCVFSSKLDRIIQQQGRQGQLNISFGTGEHSNCRGITPDELQRINFDLIDFSDFYEDIYQKEHIDDPSAINERIKNQINQVSHGVKR